MSLIDKIKQFANSYVLPLLLSSALVLFPLSLLAIKMIDPLSYVALTALMVFIFFLYKTYPRIIEVSVSGNTVKLQQKMNEAEVLTRQLESLRTITIKHSLQSLSSFQGGFKDFYNQLCGFESICNLCCKEDAIKGEVVDQFSLTAQIMKNKCSNFFDFNTFADGKSEEEVVRDFTELMSSQNNFDDFDGYKLKSMHAALCYVVLDDFIVGLSKGSASEIHFPLPARVMGLLY